MSDNARMRFLWCAREHVSTLVGACGRSSLLTHTSNFVPTSEKGEGGAAGRDEYRRLERVARLLRGAHEGSFFQHHSAPDTLIAQIVCALAVRDVCQRQRDTLGAVDKLAWLPRSL